MIHVSFAMTSEAYADGSKTETRRFWKPKHAAKFKPGVVFMGITKDFRAGGEKMHPARVVFCRLERLGNMSQDSFEREGGRRYWRDRDDYIRVMGGEERVPYVLRFEHIGECVNESTDNRGGGDKENEVKDEKKKEGMRDRMRRYANDRSIVEGYKGWIDECQGTKS